MKTIYLSPHDDLQKTFDNICEPTLIHLGRGIYRQKCELCADNVTLIGESRETTVISGSDYAKKIHADGKEYNTFRTYTLCVTGNNVRLENLTVENTNTAPEKVGQCVALSVNGKMFFAENVTLKSTQDTLFMYPFPDDLVVRYRDFLPARQLYTEGNAVHYFKNCDIYGTVDFIFGCSEAYFDGCNIISVNDARNTGFVAAPAHPLAAEYGFNFINCRIKNGGALKASCYLARPWRDFGKCAFINCNAGEHINPALFDKWNDTERDKTARFLYYNLNCAFTPEPAGWARRLTGEEAELIIKRAEKNFKALNR